MGLLPPDITSLPNDLPIEECLKEEDECMNKTKPLWKFKCVLQTGKCLIGRLAKCGFVCIPETVKCALHNILRPLKRVQCYTSGLAACVKKNCDGKKTTAAPRITKKSITGKTWEPITATVTDLLSAIASPRYHQFAQRPSD